MKYRLDEKMGARDLILYGLQWFTVTIPSLIILSGIVAGMFYDGPAMMTVYLQKNFLVTGAALLVQILWGHRMPIVIGPSSILLIGLTATLSLSPDASFTAIAIGGVLLFLISFTRIFDAIQRIFTSRVIVVTLILVSVSLMPMIINLSRGTHGDIAFNMTFALLLALAMVFANHLLRGIAKSMVILFGLLFGSLLYMTFTGLPDVAEGAGYSWRLLAANFFIRPELSLPAIIAFLFCYLALIVNELGSIQATAAFLNAGQVSERTQKGIRVGGFFNGVSGMMGLVGLLNFSLSPGVIAATRVSSRYPLLVTGALLIVCGLIPQLLFVFSYIPAVVMGGLMFYLMAIQLGAGFQLMVRENAVPTFNTLITVSLPVLVSLFISFAPDDFKNAVAPLLRPILTNGFVMGIVTVLLLDNTLCRGLPDNKPAS